MKNFWTFVYCNVFIEEGISYVKLLVGTYSPLFNIKIDFEKFEF